MPEERFADATAVPYREPLVSFRRPSHSVLTRFVAHLVIRLLIITPLPQEWQALSVLFPVSMLWTLLETGEQGGAEAPESRSSVPEDPFGNVTTFTRSQFIEVDAQGNPTGRVAVGPGGGTVTGEGGVEMTIPDGALEKGITLKIKGISTAEWEQVHPGEIPNLTDESGAPLVNVGSVLQIESPDMPTYKKEVDLAFPVPDFTKGTGPAPENPEDAAYYVFRRIEGPVGTDGKPEILYETIDQANYDAKTGKVKTASPPFAGYMTSFGAQAIDGGLTNAPLVSLFLTWTYSLEPMHPPALGVITGKVLRTRWAENNAASGQASSPEYDGIPSVVVKGPVRNNKQMLAVTRSDGRYTMYDVNPAKPGVVVSATVGGTTRTAAVYESDVTEWTERTLAVYTKKGTGNITFPAVAPPPPVPDLEVKVYRLEGEKRVEAGGIVVSGAPLVIGFKNNNKKATYTITGGAKINGVMYGVREVSDDPNGLSQVLAETFTPAQAGAYTVEAVALPATGQAMTFGATFRVLAGTGSPVDNDPNAAPGVITSRTVPAKGRTGIPVTTYIQVSFTEPVKRILSNLTLTGPEGSVPVTISAVDESVSPARVVEALTSDNEVVTTITVQPRTSLRYSSAYTLTLNTGIVDLDTPAKALAKYETTFTTFGPVSLIEPGTGETFASPGIVVLDGFAYLVDAYDSTLTNATLRKFKVEDPLNPEEITTAWARVFNRAVDMAGDGTTVVVGSASTSRAKPSNVYIYDVSQRDSTRMAGAATVANSALDGFITRVAVKGSYAYALTYKKGLQVVDIDAAKTAWPIGGSALFSAQSALQTDGQGFGQEAVVATIPIERTPGTAARMWDLRLWDFAGDTESKTLALATGEIPLLVVDPVAQSEVSRPAVQLTTADNKVSQLVSGSVLAVGRVASRNLAAIVGSGSIAGGPTVGVLAIVALDDPASPQTLSIVKLEGATGSVTDVLFNGEQILIGTSKEVVVYGLNGADVSAPPAFLGVLNNIAGKLTIDDRHLLFGSAKSLFGGNDVLGGVRTAALGSMAIIQKVTPVIVAVDADGKSAEPITVTYRVIGSPYGVTGGSVRFSRDDQVIGEAPATGLSDGRYDVTLPAGLEINVPSEVVKVSLPKEGGAPGDEVVQYVEAPGASGAIDWTLAPPAFKSLSPRYAARGSGDVSLRIEGSGVASLVSVYARDPSAVVDLPVRAEPDDTETTEPNDGSSEDAPNEWTALTITARGADFVVVKLPAAMLAKEGFLQIAPRQDVAASLAFMVSDPSAPAVGTAASFGLASVDPQEIGTVGSSLRLTGSGFVDGMAIAVGRSGAVGVVRAATLVSDTELEAVLSANELGRADDLFVAVLSVDRASLSGSVAVESNVTPPVVNYAAMLASGEKAITNVSGALAWNKDAQELLISGIGLQDGDQILFQAGAQQQTATALPVNATQQTAAAAQQQPAPDARVRVRVPNRFTHWPRLCLTLRLDAPTTMVTAPRCIGAQNPVYVPLGGRRKLVPYWSPSDEERIYIIAERDPEWMLPPGTCAPRSQPTYVQQPMTYNGQHLSPLTPTSVEFRITHGPPGSRQPGIPTIAHPLTDSAHQLPELPLVEREWNRCDPDNPNVLYFRGVRYPKPGEAMTVTASFTDPASGRTKTGDIAITVGPGQLGDPRLQRRRPAQIDAGINMAAGNLGVPPQFLKGQADNETTLDPERFRYEPVTIDFYDIGRDSAPRRNDTYVGRHILAGTAVSATTEWRCAVIVGPGLNPTPQEVAPCTLVQGSGAHVAPGVLLADPSTTRIQGRVGRLGAGSWPPGTCQHLATYRDAPITVTRNFATPPATPVLPLVRVEQPHWSHLRGYQRIQAQPGQYQVDFLRNTFRLGAPLGQYEWLVVTYRALMPDVVSTTTNTSTRMPPVTFLSGRVPTKNGVPVSFAPGNSIAQWIASNAGQQKGLNWMVATCSEACLEFALDGNGRRTWDLIDRRFELATGQFWSAGSFGMWQATLKNWDKNSHSDVTLNKVFDIGGTSGGNSLSELFTRPLLWRVREGAALASASHSFWLPRYPRACTQCDQVDWAKRWSNIIRRYGPGGRGYPWSGHVNAVLWGLEQYDAR